MDGQVPDNRDEQMPSQRLWKALNLSTLLSYWAAIAFLIAVVRLFLLQGMDIRVLGVYLLPPLLAVGSTRSNRTSTRILGATFLTLVDFGLLIAPFEMIFPNLGRGGVPLPPHDVRILHWYLVIYLLFLFVIAPPFLFIRGLLDKHYHRQGGFSMFTCILGLITWAIVGPGMVWVLYDRVGLWPIRG